MQESENMQKQKPNKTKQLQHKLKVIP